jgi:hypothetical protein
MFASVYTPCPSREPISIWNAGMLYAQYKAQAERLQRLIMHANSKVKVFIQFNKPKEPLSEESFRSYLYEAKLCKLESCVMELQCELELINREMKDIEREFAQYELFNKCKE